MAFRVFISNIETSVSVDNLKGILSQISPVKNVVIAIDQKTKLPKGFGFAEFESEEDCKKVIEELNGYVLNGKALKLSEDKSFVSQDSQPKKEHLPPMQRLNLLTSKKREIALDPSLTITFKSYKVVAQALSQRGKILGKKYTGFSTRTQEKVKKAIKRAQFFGLLRYADMKFQRKSLTRQASSLMAAD